MLIVYAPDARAQALAQRMEAERCIPAAQADDGALARTRALLLVTTDFYSRALWRLKDWITAHAQQLEGKLCACLVLCAGDGGAELAMRSLVSQLMAAQCPVYLCAAACEDGRIRPGGGRDLCGFGMSPPEYHTKLMQMAAKFG